MAYREEDCRRFGLSLAILITIGVVSYKSELKYIDTSRLKVKTQMILKKLEIVLTKMTDAETGQRGYIITGDERYLEPYLLLLRTLVKKSRNFEN